MSPICGIEVVRAQWSLWLVAIGVMVVSKCIWLVVDGSRRSQWSSGVVDGRYVVIVGPPMCAREVVLQNSARGVLWEVGCWAGVPWRSPPNRIRRSGCSCVSRVASQVTTSWYACLPCGVLDCGR